MNQAGCLSSAKKNETQSLQVVERAGKTGLSGGSVVPVPALREADRQSLRGKLKRASVSEFKAKDIFRASHLPLLGDSNSHVQKDRKRIQAGRALSPLLLIRDSANGKVLIADGYHRLCAVYAYNEDAVIPCKIA